MPRKPPPVNRGGRRSGALVQQRVEKVIDVLLNGCERRHVIQMAAAQGWGASIRSIDDYIRRATDEIAVMVREHKQNALTEAIAKFNHIYLKAMATGDLRAAMTALVNVCNLLNLGPPVKGEGPGPGGGSGAFDVRSLTDEQLNEQIRELEQRRTRGLPPATAAGTGAAAAES